MKVFVANITKQNNVLSYVYPEIKNPITVEISAGSQIELPNNFGNEELEILLGQLSIYGFRKSTDKPNGKLGHLIYAIDRPIKLNLIADGVEQIELEEQETARTAAINTVASLSTKTSGLAVETYAETEKAGRRSTKLALGVKSA